MAESQTLYQRQLANLEQDLKPIMAELLDERVTDIMVNPGGELWIKRFGEATSYSGRIVEREEIPAGTARARLFARGGEATILAENVRIYYDILQRYEPAYVGGFDDS